MLYSCKYCGKIHNKNFDCGKKPAREKRDTEASKFRSRYIWRKTRDKVKKRDKYLCQACIRGIGEQNQIPYLFSKELQVHHIIPIEEDEAEALNENNLITLCPIHHKMAEEGKISRKELRKWIET